MPFDGNGNWTADFSAVADRDSNIKIMASRFDNIHQADLKESFENCLTKDMQVKPLQNFNANNFRVINVANPVQDNDAVNKQTLESNINTLLSSLYPIGSIYIGTQTTCPMESLISGSTWTLVSSGKALWTGDGTNGNTTINAGLPNITGNFSYEKNGYGNLSSYSGAFSVSTTSGYAESGGSAGSNSNAKVSFNAHSSNSIYGNSNTVQPPAYVVNVWRRTA